MRQITHTRYADAKIARIWPLLLYLLINLLFSYKYGLRLGNSMAIGISVFYALFLVLVGLAYQRHKLSEAFYQKGFWGLAVLLFFYTLVLNNLVSGLSLNVDRWSALEVGIKGILTGTYPYATLDHLGREISSLPTLILVSMPFHFLGDIGYLQSASLLLYVYLLFRYVKTYQTRLFALLMLVCAAAYHWEVYVKSDLCSNFIWVLAFLLWAYERWKPESPPQTLILIAAGSAALVLTRVVVVIPLSILLFYGFWRLSWKQKAIFLGVGILIGIFLLWLVFKDAESLTQIQAFNPFKMQDRQLPTWLSGGLVVLACGFSFTLQKRRQLIIAVLFCMSLSVMLSFGIAIAKHGLYLAVVESYYDISYWNMVVPFLGVGVAEGLFQSKIANS